jgi:hypothetical protein
MRAAAGAILFRVLFFTALQARDMPILSANAIRSSLNFISELFGRFLYALAWEEKY